MDFASFFNNFWATSGVTLIKVFAILVFGIILIRIIKRYAKKALTTSSLETGLSSFLLSLITAILYILLIFLVLSTLGVSMGAFIAALSAAGLAIALALQDSLSNLASGILILFNKPFVEGDYIKVGSEEGVVKSVRIFTTQIETYDKKVITLPNKSIVNGNVVNYTTSPLRRVTIDFCVSYDADQEYIKSVVREAFKDNKLALKSPKLFIGIDRYSEHGVVFEFKIWGKSEDYWDLYYDAYEKLTDALHNAGIKITNNESVVKFSPEEIEAKKQMFKKSTDNRASKAKPKKVKAEIINEDDILKESENKEPAIEEAIAIAYEETPSIESSVISESSRIIEQHEPSDNAQKKKKRKWLWGRDDE